MDQDIGSYPEQNHRPKGVRNRRWISKLVSLSQGVWSRQLKLHGMRVLVIT